MTSFLRHPLSHSRLPLLVLVLLCFCLLQPTRGSLPYTADPVVLSSISGCAASGAQNASGCHSGDTVLITGRGFGGSAPLLPVVGQRACASFRVLSNTSIQCVLPGPASDAEYGTWLPLYLLLQDNSTSNALYLSYSSIPVIRSLSGCHYNNWSWSWGCLPAQSQLTVFGASFVWPLNVTLSNDFVPPYRSYACDGVMQLADGNLICTVPAVAAMDADSLLSVRVTSAGVTSAPFFGTTVNNASQVGRPVIVGVIGCADGAASRCQIGDSVTIVGSGLRGDAVGYVGGRACQWSQVNHPTSLVCTLPALDDYTAWQPVVVWQDGRFTNVVYLGVHFDLTLRLDSVFGCEGAARQCRPGDVVSVLGEGFVPWPLTALVNGVPCNQTVWRSSQQLECGLPDLCLNGQLVQLVVLSANMTSNAVYIAYNFSQPASSNSSIPVTRVPRVFSLSGCATTNGSSTFGCAAGQLLTIRGANFSYSATVQLIGPYVFSACMNASTFDMSVITCTLPAVPQDAVGELLGVEVTSWSQRSTVFYGLTIGFRGSNSSTNTTAPPTPHIRYLQGCVQDGDSTLYCHAGQTLSVIGSNFSMPATVLLDGLYACQWVLLSADGQTLSCSIPQLPESAVGRLLSITVNCNNRSSDAFMGMSTLNSLSVTAVAALNGSCSRGANSVLFGCAANDSVVVYGTGFGLGPLTVLLSLQTLGSRLMPCAVTRLIDQRRVLCDLPAAPAMQQLLSVVVYSGNLYSAALPALLYGQPAAPNVTSISGCGPYQQQSVGCRAGSLLTVTGVSFFDPVVVRLTSSRSGDRYVCGNAQLAFAAGSITCSVPQVERVDNNASLMLTVQSVGGTSAYSPSVSISTLGNLTLSVIAVRGCETDYGNSSVAFSCYAFETVTLTGSGFSRAGQGLSVLVAGRSCTPVWVQDDESLHCGLPQLNDSALLGQWLPVEVLTQSDASNVLAAAVSYNAAVPAVFSISGCPRNMTSGCVSGGLLSVAGVNLRNVSSVLIEQVPCLQVQVWPQMLSCQLPALSASYLDRWLSLRVEISGGRTALVVPAAIRYAALMSSSAASTAMSSSRPVPSSTASLSSSTLAPRLPSSTAAAATSAPRPLSSTSVPLGPLSLDGVSGCAVDIMDGTSGCRPYDVVTITGSGFAANPIVNLGLAAAARLVCQVLDSTRMRCELPDIDPAFSNQWQPVVVQLGRQRAQLTPGVRYASISLSSTGSADAATSRFGLSIDELVLIVVAVSVVVGLLLVLQLLWCLSRCCGVALPCCSRLCPATQKRSDDEHQEQEIHLGLLPNDQLVVHRQSPLPAAAVAIAYEPPQPQPQHQHPVYPAALQPQQARTLLLPRSFVPSPEYYQ